MEVRRHPAAIGEDQIFAPNRDKKSGRQRLKGRFDDQFIKGENSGSPVYELAKILGDSNLKLTELSR